MIRSQLADQPGGIFFFGDSPNDEAEIKGYPFVGSDGHLLTRALRAAGLSDPSNPAHAYLGAPLAETRRLLWERRAHSFSTVLDTQPRAGDPRWHGVPIARNDGLKSVPPEHIAQLQRLIRELKNCRPNIVVTMGDLALWALTGQCSTEEWRGAARLMSENAPIVLLAAPEDHTMLCSLKIFPTYPPERVLQQYKLLGVLIADLMKVRHEASFPEIRSLEIAVWLEPSLDDLQTFFQRHVRPSELITLDIETAVGQIVCVQIGTSATTALVLPFVDYRKSSRSYWAVEADELAAWSWLAKVLDTPQPKLGQNFAAYDAFWLLDRAGLSIRNYRHDLRLVHHILQPEWPKSLAFMGMYTQMPKWKADVHHGGTAEKRDS